MNRQTVIVYQMRMQVNEFSEFNENENFTLIFSVVFLC